jgi:hypothetical protein
MEQKKSCKSCKKEGLTTKEWFLFLFGMYILITSIWGTNELIKKLFF